MCVRMCACVSMCGTYVLLCMNMCCLQRGQRSVSGVILLRCHPFVCWDRVLAWSSLAGQPHGSFQLCLPNPKIKAHTPSQLSFCYCCCVVLCCVVLLWALNSGPCSSLANLSCLSSSIFRHLLELALTP